MEFEFEKKKFEKLYTEEKGAEKYPPEVIDAFFELLAIIEGAPDERNFRNLKGLRFKKISTKEYSMRLNDSWRMIITFEKSNEQKTVVIKEINNHYGD